ncbi:hypothetical protein E2C01_046867 [Portunus trituberculatus]|uniref:Uncharacterized protein n=1 Tax=Portunus trituberculatus TaxID=210409 RepID=A0A5B7G662_PORTR|nr:hypothetical protein [Portunus trituberculatus]
MIQLTVNAATSDTGYQPSLLLFGRHPQLPTQDSTVKSLCRTSLHFSVLEEAVKSTMFYTTREGPIPPRPPQAPPLLVRTLHRYRASFTIPK